MKAIRNLQEELFAFVKALGDDKDRRFQAWCKYVDSVNTSKTDGYAFVGSFVPNGTVEIEVMPRLFVVMTQAGSMKHHNATYRVVRMTETGTLENTGIVTTGETHGWALRIRDAVAQELANIQPKLTLSKDEATTGAREILKALAEMPVLGDQERYQKVLSHLSEFVEVLAT